jgi:acyl carrier protein
MVESIRAVLRDHARLAVDVDALGTRSDLYDAGLTSSASVDVLLALEDRFGVEFPDELLRRSSFETIDAIRAALVGLGAGETA